MISAIHGYNINSFARGIQSKTALSKAMSRLSSGLRINSASDSPAQMGISESLRARKSGINVAINNLKGGNDLLNTADQSLEKMSDLLRRLRDLSLKSANSSLTDQDRQSLQVESNQLLSEIQRISETTEFNNISLLNGNIGLNARITDKRFTDMVNHFKVTDVNAVDGEYKVKVLQNASTGTGAFIGKVLQPTDPIPDLGNTIGDLIGASSSGVIKTAITAGSETLEVSFDTRDTIQESLDNLNAALRGNGMDASAYYVKPGVAGSTVTWDISQIISEPIDQTVPVVWNTNPFADNTLYDNQLFIDFTSDTTFNLIGNRTGSHGSFNTGDEISSRGINFNIAPDAGGHTYSAGDRIVINASPTTRTANIISNNIGITSVVQAGYIPFADGEIKTLNASANPYQIKSINTSGVHGEAPPVSFSSIPSANNLLKDSQITLTFTGSNNFSALGNVSGNLGSGSGGSLFTSNDNAVNFNLDSDPAFVAGDKIILNFSPPTKASVSGGVISSFPLTIFDGLNDQLAVSVNGTYSEIDLTAGGEIFNTGADLASFVENAINSDPLISGAAASVDASFSGGKLVLTSNDTGSTGSIQIHTPPVSSANASLGLSAGPAVQGTDASYNGFSVQQLPPVISGLSITAQPANTLKSEQFTMQLITDADGADVWSVNGSVSGSHDNFVTGDPSYVTNSTAQGGGGIKIALNPNSKFAPGDRITFWSRNDGTIALNPDSTPTSILGNSSAYVTDDNNVRFRVYTGSDFSSGTAQIQIGSSGTASVGTLTYNTPPPSINFSVQPELLPSNNILQDQVYTLTLIDDKDGADVWSVTGSLSGIHNNYVSGSDYVSDSGSIGNGAGLHFNFDPDNRLHIGSVIKIGINTDKPRIEIKSNVPGSANGIDVAILTNDTDGLAAGSGSESYTIGNLTSGITESTIISTSTDNPYDNIGIEPGNFIVQSKTGAIYTVTLNYGDRISDIVNKISSLSPDITASWNSSTKGIDITDSSGAAGNFKIFDLPGSTIAADLEITGESEYGIRGRGITRTDDYVLEITGPDGSSAIVNASSHNNSTVIKAGRGFSESVKSTTNDNETYSGGVLGVEIALNSDNIQEGSEFSFTVSRGNLNLQASDTSGSFGRLDLLIGGLTLSDLGFSDEPGSFNISDAESAKNIIDSGLIDNALEKVTSLRGQIGAFTNRIDHSSLVQSTYKLNIMSAESRIRDIDYAAEIMNYVKERIIQQSSTAMKSHTMNSEKMFFKTLFS